LKKIRVSVTGSDGFIGYHLSTHIKHLHNYMTLIPFSNEFFGNKEKLKNCLRQCDVIVHLAGKNRGDDKDIYKINIHLVNMLVSALESLDEKKHVIFASSSHEGKNNAYGLSKQKGHETLRSWAEKSNGTLTTFIIPNVFGPFCKPFYNSVIATFCHQLNNNERPEIFVDAEIGFIYVGVVVEKICELINNQDFLKQKIEIDVDRSIKVSDILSQLNLFKESYFKEGIIPELKNQFETNLFNTFRSFVDIDDLEQKLYLNIDNRGTLFEIVKENTGGQSYFSVTKPGIVRGNHFHTRKIERFCVVSGNAIIRLRKIGSKEIYEYQVSGENPVVIDMPIYFSHNIENNGNSDLLTFFWSNEIFDPNNTDTYFEDV